MKKTFNRALAKTCFAVALSSYAAIGTVYGKDTTDTIRFYASEEVFKLKGRQIFLSGRSLELYDEGKNHIDIFLSKEPHEGLIEIQLVIQYLNIENVNFETREAEYYFIIGGEKQKVSLSALNNSPILFTSHIDKRDYFLLPDGKIKKRYFHNDHYSHYSSAH